MKKNILLYLSLLLSMTYLQAQNISKPNFAMASHPLKVLQIETNANNTIVYLSIKNQSLTGAFCVDSKVYIKDVLADKKTHMLYADGIPTCPEAHTFARVGESLEFKLIFPKIAADAKYLDLIEDCTDHCFFLQGIILDTELNKLVNDAYVAYAQGKFDEATALFEQAITYYPDYPYGFIYFNLIKIHSEQDNWEKTNYWYSKLSESYAFDKEYYLDIIRTKKYIK